MAKKKNEVSYGVMDGFFENTIEDNAKQKINPESLKNLHPRTPGTAKPKAYMQLNIYGYEDYIYRMSKIQKKTMTRYVIDLIEKDMKKNLQAYEGLKLIKELDKPKRIAKNTKKNSNNN